MRRREILLKELMFLPDRLTKTVVLVGMMGAGKTAVGTALARLLEVPFVDMDAEIEKAAAMSVAEIFARDGEAFFRQRESAILDRLLDAPAQVLSTGGGVFISKANRDLIDQKGVAVWLDADLDLLWSRVRHKSTRPLLQTENPFQTLEALYKDRVETYALAEISVKAAPNLTIDEMAAKVRTAIKAAGNAIIEDVHVR